MVKRAAEPTVEQRAVLSAAPVVERTVKPTDEETGDLEGERTQNLFPIFPTIGS